jgi:predicted transcriptional regulator
MKKKTRSILEEIRRIDVARDREHFIESKAENLVAGTANLLELINESYDEATASDLTKRLINALRTQDPKKFQRGIRKVNESRGRNSRTPKKA